jgi:hypothetical protein
MRMCSFDVCYLGGDCLQCEVSVRLSSESTTWARIRDGEPLQDGSGKLAGKGSWQRGGTGGARPRRRADRKIEQQLLLDPSEQPSGGAAPLHPWRRPSSFPGEGRFTNAEQRLNIETRRSAGVVGIFSRPQIDLEITSKSDHPNGSLSPSCVEGGDGDRNHRLNVATRSRGHFLQASPP